LKKWCLNEAGKHNDTSLTEKNENNMEVPSLKRIMYVDDDPDLQDIVRLALETRSGLTVKSCCSGKEAIEEIVHFQPDLVLLDLVLPDLKGTRLLKVLPEIPGRPRTPVIFLSAKIQPGEVEKYKKWGAIGVINKPFNPLTLARHVRDIWEEKARKREG
jgi:two-component system OmpR family response regulator